MTAFPLKSSDTEQCAVVCFFCGLKDIMQMLFTLKCIKCMVTNVLQDRQYMLGVRSLLVAEKAFDDKKRPGRHVMATTDQCYCN